MRNPRVLCNIHGNSPSGLRLRARACIFHKTLGLMLYLLHTTGIDLVQYLVSSTRTIIIKYLFLLTILYLKRLVVDDNDVHFRSELS